MKFSTPLRYPGGKGKLTDYFKTIFVENDLVGGDYAEPYAGGAGIGINLLLGEYARKLYLNDLNRSVYAFWRTLLDQTDEFCALVSDTEVSIQEWHRQKKIQSDESASPLELGFSTFFLNRTNRSGIIIAGVIGGKDQTGPWKLDARFNKIDLLARIELIARNRDRISLSNLDAIEFLKREVPKMSKKSLVYLDPPYYVKGQGLYENHYDHNDHQLVSMQVLKHLKRPWVVSYDYAPQISAMYEGVRSCVYGINYSAQKRYTGAEVMFFSKTLIVPDIANPAKPMAA